ncbi:hypothetical protein Droror1_Dr00022854 [Drosera rotundifolia]
MTGPSTYIPFGITFPYYQHQFLIITPMSSPPVSGEVYVVTASGTGHLNPIIALCHHLSSPLNLKPTLVLPSAPLPSSFHFNTLVPFSASLDHEHPAPTSNTTYPHHHRPFPLRAPEIDCRIAVGDVDDVEQDSAVSERKWRGAEVGGAAAVGGDAVGLMFNTCTDLLRPFVEYVGKGLGLPVWAVGPMLLERFWAVTASGSLIRDTEARGEDRNFSVSDKHLIQWLDMKSRGSVLFVCFRLAVGRTAEYKSINSSNSKNKG